MTDKKAAPEIILLHESALKSWLVDASTFALFLGLIGIGVALHSDAMQWCGAMVAFISVIGKSSVRSKRYTLIEARARLDEIEKEGLRDLS